MILVAEKIVLYLNIKNGNNSFVTNLYNYILANEEQNKKKKNKSYKSNEIKEINTIIDDSTFIVLGKNNEIYKVDRQSDIESKKGEKLLFHIRKNKDSTYYIENPIPLKILEENSDILNLKLYLTLNSDQKNENNINEDYILCNNDIIKLGNIKYLVIMKIKKKENKIENKIEINNIIKKNEVEQVDKNEGNEKLTETGENNSDNSISISNHENHENQLSDERTIEEMNYDISSLNKSAEPIFDSKIQSPLFYNAIKDNLNIKCYICNNKDCNEGNPIIQFCKCYYIHLECIKKWAKKKMFFRENSKKNVKNYYIKRIMCKKCKYFYPYEFLINGQVKKLIDIELPKESDYIMLKSIENKVFFNNLEMIHVIELKEETVKIGRCKKDGVNDVIIRDPSVSKEHAIINYNKENGKVILKNINSKYGSLVLIKKSLKINAKKLQIQIGKTSIETQVMKFEDFEKNFKDKNTRNPLPKKY